MKSQDVISKPGLDSGAIGHRTEKAAGFTLVELLAGMAVLGIMMMLLFQALSSSSAVWARSTGKIQAFQAARAGFESMTRNLGQATLQSYHGYADAAGNPIPLINPSFKPPTGTINRNQVPTQYLRMSELHLVSGSADEIFATANIHGITSPGHAVFFQAPLGFSTNPLYSTDQSLLTVCGYYTQFTDNAEAIPPYTSSAPTAPKPASRYRLMEVLQSAERNSIYESTNTIDSNGLPENLHDLDWLRPLNLSTSSSRHVLAENVLFLYFLPRLSAEEEIALGGDGSGSILSPGYHFDSRSWEPGYTGAAQNTPATRNQLPPIVEVIMVATDERSAIRLQEQYGAGGSPPLQHSGVRAILDLEGRFTEVSKLRGPGGDLERLQSGLNDLRINYRIFHTEVPLQAGR